ncbi:MAG: nucleotidyl transferase AbiEii/AbiGii toxin family protein [Candidatus Thermoplasmatota archaeon]|nr:nucleotidyl transferase AbiEii/AbiGii toxin family protein [Euryarchaeota archaeon]MBU4031567.1 nucleotidyl transferase AbiEii/AbiGii toxin family protein [Candidatus Thermoplasmatota archaeon]MBU4071356.1 nucleotidyl transferase AbiEii/AbiGii toxin family protein [Candidatus Thermoplasmatota archaeon]MBU4144646.1 nucleotidyl transferase AbiEii/AbiGii toxin family protein [Candidatus Thermoplasmatota archaeon]MBU4592476.1 nucleotidyl transferase AbiEii/AbiGii toxin family protein [Candidatus
MISRAQLASLGRRTGMNLYQQEKDYALKLFLFNYFRRFRGAVFKGGTCIKYLFGTGRFSEDLDFNLLIDPLNFATEVRRTLKELELAGLKSGFIREEVFDDAYTCEIWFHGPLYDGKVQNRNRFRIDAGKRIGLEMEPRWLLIRSEYPETMEQFLVCAMDAREILVEKILALRERRKGRDLYDIWFLLQSGISLDTQLYRKKSGNAIGSGMVSRAEYERDMKKLTRNPPEYGQLRREVEAALMGL